MKRILLTLAVAAAALAATAQTAPKYIFYYIGDGMGLGPVMAAENYNRMVLQSESPLAMNTFPVVSWCQTYSANSPVTDSAAAGTALATGWKTFNGMLGMNPDSAAVSSVAAEFFAAGYGVGIATSVAADDATPGAFYAHVPSRKMRRAIDCQLAESGYQFVAGAGLQGLEDAQGNPTGAPDSLAAAGVTIVRGPEGAADRTPAPRKLLVGADGFHPWNVGYTIDSIEGALSLPMIAEACLAQLEATSPDRFFMMVEGGNIDHALHANDGGAAVKEILNFNRALAVAVDFYRAHPDETLIIVTADHDTGGMALQWNSRNIRFIDHQRISKEEFSDYCKSILRSRRNYTWDDMKEYLNEQLGLFGAVPVSEEQTAHLQELFDQTFELRNSADQQTLYANFNAFAVEVFRIFNAAAGFAFTNTGHSGNPVPVYAMGAGADLFKGLNNNIDIPRRIRALTGLAD